MTGHPDNDRTYRESPLNNGSGLTAPQTDEWFARFMEFLPGLAWIKDVHGRYVYANDSAAAAFGTTLADLRGKSDDDVFPPETAAQFKANDRKAIVTGTNVQAVESLEHPDGTLHYSLVNKFPIPGRDGDPALVGGVAIEITDRLQTESSLQIREEHLRAVVETTQECIKVVDEAGLLVDMNSAGLMMIEAPSFEVVKGQSVYPIIAEEHRAAYREFNERICRGERGSLEFDIIGLNGTRRSLETRAVPLRGPAGQRMHLAITRDVTQRKTAERRLKNKNARLQLLAEAAEGLLLADEPDAMLRQLFASIAPHFGLDTYFNYMVNDQADALRLESCHGIPSDAAYQIRRLEFGQAVCGNVALQKKPVFATHIQQSEDPKVQLVKSFGIRAYACHPLMAGERLLGTLSFASRIRDAFDEDELEFFRTICQYVAAAYERVRLIRQLKDADRRKDEFLATLAHELRNPLAPIRNSLHILRMNDEDNLNQPVHEMMERQVNHLVRLVDDLLEVSRITRGAIQLRKERVEVSSAVRNAIDTSRPLIESAGHRLVVSIPPTPLSVEADPVRLSQVIANLLNNAAKYTEPGGEIGISVAAEGSRVSVRVRDTGIGIPQDMLVRVFEMFTQVDRDHKRSQGGLGIGLSLAKGLVEMHGGRIEARSDGIGKGTEFEIHLPLIISDAIVTESDGAEEASGRRTRHRILVVDDNRDAATSLALLLRVLGNDVECVNDGPTALEALDLFRPSVVLLDLGMPGMSGFEVAEQLHARPDADSILLVALTGWGQEDDRQRTRDAGFDHHLVKPVDLDALSAILANS